MSGSVDKKLCDELVCGSIFDKKCDVIIIPCNDEGGITNEMRENLIINEISNLPHLNRVGDILFEESRGGFANATIIGFAASVDASMKKSKLEYVKNICEEIKMYCKLNSFSIINIPLLGTGAGGLDNKEVFTVLKNTFKNETDINAKIFAFDKEVYTQIVDFSERGNTIIKNPRVFISYTGENAENRKWVKDFVYKLRMNGVNARVDMFHLKPGYDLAQWMTNELLMADKVIIVCDSCYAKKADSRKGGVGWETMIIQGDMMTSVLNNKYICIVREKNIDDGIPIYAKTKFFLQWTETEISEEKFQELLFDLFECNIEPKLGEIPSYVIDKLNKSL